MKIETYKSRGEAVLCQVGCVPTLDHNLLALVTDYGTHNPLSSGCIILSMNVLPRNTPSSSLRPLATAPLSPELEVSFSAVTVVRARETETNWRCFFELLQFCRVQALLLTPESKTTA